ncbi:hypothetical protein PoB_004893600 [Plakobranchus ocellatus]|uniref:Uncharacterized protein n=1 Tax=Plakobranchus ocellatus TaxID=259542 RepID=A0AAV4BPP4_9GAST|nr:hypothetical protein PoB_004893600 [Plakobranchus ocellatus]
MDKVVQFCRRNAMILTCGTIFVSMHYIWLQMQFDSDFVPEKRQRDEVKLGWMTFNNPHKAPEESEKVKIEQTAASKED